MRTTETYTPFATTYLNNPKKLKIGIVIGKFPTINSQELQISKFLTGQGEGRTGGVGASVPVTKIIRINLQIGIGIGKFSPFPSEQQS